MKHRLEWTNENNIDLLSHFVPWCSQDQSEQYPSRKHQIFSFGTLHSGKWECDRQLCQNGVPKILVHCLEKFKQKKINATTTTLRILTQQMIIGFSFVLEQQTTVADVIQIFKPFKIGNGHTTSVDVQVGNNQNFALQQNFIGSRCCRTVGSFCNYL